MTQVTRESYDYGVIPTRSWLRDYVRPHRIKIIIRDNTRTKTLHTFNAFAGKKNDIKIYKSELSTGAHQSGNFSFEIDDTKDRVIDQNIIDCGCWIDIQFSQDNTTWTNMISGHIDNYDYVRDGPIGIRYRFNGEGAQSLLGHYLAEYSVSAPVTSEGDFRHDNTYQAWKILVDFFTKSGAISGTKKTLEELTQFTLDNISQEVITPIFQMFHADSFSSEIIAAIAEMSGGDFAIDEHYRVSFQPARFEHSSLDIKTLYETTDNEAYTGYIIGSHSINHSIRSDTGFANYIKGNTQMNDVIGQFDSSFFTSSYNRDIGQQFVPSATQLSLGIVLSRHNLGWSVYDPDYQYVHIKIVGDLDDYPDPTQYIGYANVKITSIAASPTQIPLQIHLYDKNIVNRKMWILMLERGDKDNYIRWHHSGDYGYTHPYAIAERDLPFGRTEATNEWRTRDGWRTTKLGPTYSHLYFLQQPISGSISDFKSQKRWIRKDALINESWITNNRILMQYLGMILTHSSSKSLTYSIPVISIPLAKYFKPLDRCTFIDPISRVFRRSNWMITVNQTRYSMDASGDDPLGTNFCEIMPIAYQRPTKYLR
jgi:hypothetical protein